MARSIVLLRCFAWAAASLAAMTAAEGDEVYTRMDDVDMAQVTPGSGPSWLARVSGALEHDIAGGELPDGQSFVEELTEASFGEFVQANRPTMVLFYAPYCGHCKALMPAFEKAAWVLDDNDIQIARVDSTAQRELSRSLGVTGFPTLKVYPAASAGEPAAPDSVDYRGSKDPQALIDHMRLAADPSYESPVPMDMGWSGNDGKVLHVVVKTWDEIRETFPRVLAMFYAPWCTHSKNMMPKWAHASHFVDNQTALVAINCMRQDSEPLCRQFVISGFPEILYFNTSHDEGSKPDRVPLTKLGIQRFLKSSPGEEEWVPTDDDVGKFAPPLQWDDDGKVVHLDDDHFDWYRSKHELMLTLFYTESKMGNRTKQVQGDLIEASMRAPAGFSFSAVDCDRNVETCAAEKTQLEGFPTVRYFNPAESGVAAEDFTPGGFGQNLNLDADGMVSFAHDRIDQLVRREAKLAAEAATDSESASKVDLSKMRVQTLKKLLRERAQECPGCTEREDLEAKVHSTLHLPKLTKDTKKGSGRKRGKKKMHFDDPAQVEQAFFAAVRSGTKDEVEELLAEHKADVDAYDRGDKNNRALHIVAGRNDSVPEIIAITRELVAAGPIIDAENKDDSTPLHIAILNAHLDVAAILISSGANVDAQNYWGVTALHYAANRGILPAVAMLLNAGADPFLTSTADKTPSDFAQARGLDAVAEALQAAMDERVDGLLTEL